MIAGFKPKWQTEKDGRIVQKKHSSFVTAFSTCNAMLGSTLVTLPWAFQQAGWLFSIILSFTTVCISTYTCSIIVRFTRDDDDFYDSLFKYFGRLGWYIGIVSTTAVIGGAHIGMFIVLSQLLYSLIMAMYDWGSGS